VSDQTSRAVQSQCGFTRGADAHDFGVHFLQSAIVARSPSVVVVAEELNVKGELSNKPMNPTPCAASRRLLAQAARRGLCAGYRHR
jgi:hypothetical protein